MEESLLDAFPVYLKRAEILLGLAKASYGEERIVLLSAAAHALWAGLELDGQKSLLAALRNQSSRVTLLEEFRNADLHGGPVSVRPGQNTWQMISHPNRPMTLETAPVEGASVSVTLTDECLKKVTPKLNANKVTGKFVFYRTSGDAVFIAAGLGGKGVEIGDLIQEIFEIVCQLPSTNTAECST